MNIDLPVWTELRDREVAWPVESSESIFEGNVLSMTREHVRTPSGELLDREVVGHPGAVAILALDADENVVLLRQYRHPVGHELLEIPAGLLDVAGEDPWHAARRELAEETGLAASEWNVLADIATSPGGNREVVRIYLARGLTPSPRPDGFVVEGEEAHMSVGRAAAEAVRDAVLAGDVANPALSVGILAWFSAGRDATRLRPADSPWPMRERRAGRA